MNNNPTSNNTVNHQPSSQPSQPYGPPRGDPIANPGQTFGIVGIVLNFFFIHIAGIVLGILSINKSRKANAPTVLGWVSLIWGAVCTLLTLLIISLGWFYMARITEEYIKSERHTESNYQQELDDPYPSDSYEQPPSYTEDSDTPTSST